MGVHPDFACKSGGALYADIISEMDHRPGRILDALSEVRWLDRRVEASSH